ncbi:MAG: hypothetical protein GTN76_12920 [Candidatus Aenigmarchaeota archaeon]|nr:hypothetical protein [Candidatus Aenigmarchaeota archaeon]NIQ18116.1 hypothetical protein [Candidatus Aenigmarchaeota archaeon]NIT04145.1 hypothetical protein [Candidatus Saccharibacteria bacterium]
MDRKTFTFITIIILALVLFVYQITFIARAILRSDACREMNVLSRLPDDPNVRPELLKTSSVDSTVIAFQMVKRMDSSNSGEDPQEIAEAKDFLLDRYQRYLKVKERCLGRHILVPEGIQDLEQLPE